MSAFRKIAAAGGLLLVGLVAYLCFWPVPIDPVAWPASTPPGFTGAFAPNTGLAGLRMIATGREPTSENIANHKYVLARPFLILYKVDSIGQAGKSFVAFLKSDEGQKAVAEYGYTPVKKFNQ